MLWMQLLVVWTGSLLENVWSERILLLDKDCQPVSKRVKYLIMVLNFKTIKLTVQLITIVSRLLTGPIIVACQWKTENTKIRLGAGLQKLIKKTKGETISSRTEGQYKKIT